MACMFPMLPPSCKGTIGAHLGSIYSAYVILYSILTMAIALPTLTALAYHVNRKGSIAIPSLDRPHAMLVRVAVALVAFIIQAPDPLGLSAILPVTLLELTSALTSLVLVSIALSLLFRWVRSLLLVADNGLSHLSMTTRVYSLTQYSITMLWIALPIAQVVSNPLHARYLKAIPLLWTLATLLAAYILSSFGAIAILRRMSIMQVGDAVSTVTAQTRARAQYTARRIVASTFVIIVIVAPITIARTFTILSHAVYPDATFIPATFADLLLMSSFRLIKLVFASAVALSALRALGAAAGGTDVVVRAQQNKDVKDVTITLEMVNGVEAGRPDQPLSVVALLTS